MPFPKLLYRAFTDLCHAQQFVDEGRFRIGRLDKYRTVENAARVDSSEGLGHYVDADGISEHFEFGNAIYILCCSSENVDLAVLRRKMGPFVIQINDPEQLARDIAAFLHENNVKLFGEIQCRMVSYTKGKLNIDKLDAMERAELSIVQKPPFFAEDCEQRLYAIINTHCPAPLMTTDIEINLERSLPYVEILSEL